MVVAPSNRRANHWIGTAKIGTDDGRVGGTSVVDVNTKVYGTDNLFVVDASIFPGMVTTNPSALIVVAAERASERILALPQNVAQAKYAQCGGNGWYGSSTCVAGTSCVYFHEWYSQCL
jgi:cellobiose dehydrogenase (acceptor)